MPTHLAIGKYGCVVAFIAPEEEKEEGSSRTSDKVIEFSVLKCISLDQRDIHRRVLTQH
jgi:hypothetical protein